MSYFTHRSYTIFGTSKRLTTYLDKGSKVIGKVADTLCLENGAFGFTPYEGGINENPIERFHPDFALVTIYRDGRKVDKPEYMTGTEQLLERFYLCPRRGSVKYRFVVELYRLKVSG